MNQMKWSALAVGIVAFFAISDARAQVPFFNRGTAIFDPEISILNSGSVTDATATVSADRKYVTLTTRFQQANLVALRSFSFQSGSVNNQNQNNGFVGGVAALQPDANDEVLGPPVALAPLKEVGDEPAEKNPQKPAPAAKATLPSEVRKPQVESVLTRPGMTLLNGSKAANSKKAAPEETPEPAKAVKN